jgi:hypothetical protein
MCRLPVPCQLDYNASRHTDGVCTLVCIGHFVFTIFTLVLPLLIRSTGHDVTVLPAHAGIGCWNAAGRCSSWAQPH